MMKINIIGPFTVNAPFASEIAFSKGLRAIGHQVVEYDPNIDSVDLLARDADFTLVFKTALDHNDILLEMPNVILYQPDDVRFPHIQQMLVQMRQYSEHLLLFRKIDTIPEQLGRLAFKTIHTLLMTADPDIYYPVECEKDIDFCFIGSLGSHAHWQRHEMIEALQAEGHNVVWGSTQDISVIRQMYNRAKVVLNHASDESLPVGQGYGYQCRHFEAGMTRSCLLSNMELEEDTLKSFVRFVDKADLISLARELMDSEATRKMMANLLYDEVMEKHHPVVRAKELTNILESL